MEWFNCKVSFEKPMPIGNNVTTKKVSESYLVEADDFTEVEAIVAKKLMNCGGFIEVVAIHIQQKTPDLALDFNFLRV